MYRDDVSQNPGKRGSWGAGGNKAINGRVGASCWMRMGCNCSVEVGPREAGIQQEDGHR